MPEIPDFLDRFEKYASRVKNEQLIEYLREVAPPWITINYGSAVSINASYPQRVPVHYFKSQAELTSSRGQRVVLENGEVVPRSFHNPISAGDPFHVAWQRLGRQRTPIQFVKDDPTLYVEDWLLQRAIEFTNDN